MKTTTVKPIEVDYLSAKFFLEGKGITIPKGINAIISLAKRYGYKSLT